MDVIQSIFLGVATGASVVALVLLFMVLDEVIEIRKELNKQK